jgi:glucose dehydrogenase
MQRKAVAWALVFCGLATVTAGVWLLAGRGWAAITAGVALTAIGLLLVDVDRPAEQGATDDESAA